MMTEEMLAIAAGELSDAMVASVQEQPHVFSPAFQRKLRRLTRRAEHPARYQALRYAAAVLIAVFTVFGVLMLSSPTVRAAVVEWVEVTFGNRIQYAPPANTPSNVRCDYRLAEEIDGYKLWVEKDRADGKMFAYINDNKQLFYFIYFRGDTSDSMHIHDTEGCIHYTAQIGESFADIYISAKENDNSLIIWTDPETNYVLVILADATYEELIAYAQSVERINYSEIN